MTIGIYSALSGIKMRSLELENASHNLANASTAGFKEKQLSFSAVLSSKAAPGSNDLPFSDVSKETLSFDSGPITSTNRPLDVAIQGDGFFEVQTEQGIAYTRNGAFAVDTGGNLVMAKGAKVMGTNGLIDMSGEGAIAFSDNGQVTVGGEDRGQLKVVEFSKEAMENMEPIGGTMFRVKSGETGALTQRPNILQGSLESSNTNVVLNLVKLIEVARQTQTYNKVLSEQRGMDQKAANSIANLA